MYYYMASIIHFGIRCSCGVAMTTILFPTYQNYFYPHVLCRGEIKRPSGLIVDLLRVVNQCFDDEYKLTMNIITDIFCTLKSQSNTRNECLQHYPSKQLYEVDKMPNMVVYMWHTL